MFGFRGGGGGAGPSELASFVVADALDAPTNARVATEGTGIEVTDGGPGAALTFAVDTTVIATRAYADGVGTAALAAANAYTDSQIGGLGSTYATKASLTGTGYLKGAGSFPPSFSATVPVGDLSGVAAWNPTLTGLTLSGATASTYAKFDGSKALTSQTGVPVADLTGVTSWNPTFAGLSISGLNVSRYVQTDGAGALATSATAGIPRADIVNTSGATGDLLVGSGTSLGRLAVGAAGTVLKGGSTPSWAQLVNADVDSAAAIAGTKVAPDFGAQDMTSTGNLLLGPTTRAGSGLIRVANAVDIIAAKHTTSGDIPVLSTDSGNILYLGQNTAGSAYSATTVVTGSTNVLLRTSGTSRVILSSSLLRLGTSSTPVSIETAGSTVSSIGDLRGPNAFGCYARNAANTADNAIFVSLTNVLYLGGVAASNQHATTNIGALGTVNINVNSGSTKASFTSTTNTLNNTTVDIQSGATSRIKVDGTGIGVFTVPPVARASAYTQTYATATKTQSDFTSSDLTGISSSTTGSVLAEPSAAYTQSEMQQNFRRIQDQFNALRADVANVKQITNAIIDDQQAYGWFQ